MTYVSNVVFCYNLIATQIFAGGLDHSLDKDTLLKLFGIVPNMVSVEMDMDGSNNFRVFSNHSISYFRELLLLFTVIVLMRKLP